MSPHFISADSESPPDKNSKTECFFFELKERNFI